MSTMAVAEVQNYIGGAWHNSASQEILNVINPATTEVLGRGRMSGTDDVELAVKAAEAVLYEWRCTPPGDRVQYLFGLKQLLEDHIDEIARTLVQENGRRWRKRKANCAVLSKTWRLPAAFPC